MPTKRSRDLHQLDAVQGQFLESWFMVQPSEIQNRKMAQVIAKTMVDENFRKGLVENPQRLFLTGVQPVVEKKIVILEHSEDTIYLVLPPPISLTLREALESRSTAEGGKVSISDDDLTSKSQALFTWNDDINWRTNTDSKVSDGMRPPSMFGDFYDMFVNRDPIGDPDSRDP